MKTTWHRVRDGLVLWILWGIAFLAFLGLVWLFITDMLKVFS